MKLLTKCPSCAKYRLFIKKRKYAINKANVGIVTSQRELCGKCYKTIKEMLK